MTTLGKLPKTNVHGDNKQAKGNKKKNKIDNTYHYDCDHKYMNKINKERNYKYNGYYA